MSTAPVLARVASLGVVLAGCPACRSAVGLAGAEGLDAALTAHLRECPAQPDACPRCLEEARLYWTLDGWRCGDCLNELVLDDLGVPPIAAPASALPAPRRLQAASPAASASASVPAGADDDIELLEGVA